MLPTCTWFCACSVSVNSRAVSDRTLVRASIWRYDIVQSDVMIATGTQRQHVLLDSPEI